MVGVTIHERKLLKKVDLINGRQIMVKEIALMRKYINR